MPRLDTDAVLDAVSSAAVQFVAKPSGTSALRPLAYLREELFPVVRMLAGRTEPPRPGAGVPSHPGSHGLPPRSRREVPRLVTVASSTGGPDALAQLVVGLRPFPAVAIMIVQHMPGGFTTLLAERLNRLAVAPVREAADGQAILPGEVLVAPGGMHMAVAREQPGLVTRLDAGPKVNFCRPSADVLFRSAAAAEGPRVLAVVLSGMGQDGAEGSAAVVAAGGEVLAQSVESAVCPSMPAAVAHLASASLPVAGLANEIRRRCSGVGAR
jgi:two-component system chemotaxis response regulator CheB